MGTERNEQDSEADRNMSVKDGECNQQLLTLEELPEEVLMYICYFLDADVIKILMHISLIFNNLLSGDYFWRMRILQRWPKRYPAIPKDPFDWQEACLEREYSHKVWSNVTEHLEHFTYNDGLFAAVDAVHLMQNGQILASGSRDRYLMILNLDKYDVNKPESIAEMKMYSDCKLHKGWIWSIASLNNVLVTGSWDTYIKLLDLNAECAVINSFKCKSAVLDVHMEPSQVIGVSYDTHLYMVDPREGHLTSTKIHKKPILCLSVDDQFIVTGSEDNTISIFDRKAAKVMKTLELKAFPMSMNCLDNQLWIGDKEGKIHLCDTTSGAFDIVNTYDVGHSGKVTGIAYTRSALYTSSTDKTIKILEPNHNPGTINTLTSHDGEVTGISYNNKVLASAGCDISIGVWRPKSYATCAL